MSGVANAMSATPAILGTKNFLGTVYPGLGLHKASALGAALAIFDKERAILAGVVTLVSDFLCYFPTPDGMSSCLE
jgi:hypothetical protein